MSMRDENGTVKRTLEFRAKVWIMAALLAMIAAAITARSVKVNPAQTALPDERQAVSHVDKAPSLFPAAGNASAKIAASRDGVSTPSLPKLIDLGADKCIPCKMMMPILEKLKTECAGRMEVVFIDVWKNRGAAEKYGIRSIPTQIFVDASGREVFRHEGFLPHENILAKWRELGVALDGDAPTSPSAARPLKK